VCELGEENNQEAFDILKTRNQEQRKKYEWRKLDEE